jgi:hypothetical protein
MYEVDGVFFSYDKRVSEERTQVIRIMFLPNIEKMKDSASDDYDKTKRTVDKVLQLSPEDRDILKMQHPCIAGIIEKLTYWTHDIGLFLFGYLIFELCSRINELKDNSQGDLEDEIWLSSFWNLHINKIKINPQIATEKLKRPDTP